jgi:hypothetical protein
MRHKTYASCSDNALYSQFEKTGPTNPLVETAMPTVTLIEWCIFLVSICLFLGTQNHTLCLFSKPSGNVLHLRTTHYVLLFLHILPTQQTAVYVRTDKDFLQHLFCTNTGANCHANFTAQVVKVSIIVAAFVVDFLKFLWTATLTASMLYQLYTCAACLQIGFCKGVHCIPKWAQNGLCIFTILFVTAKRNSTVFKICCTVSLPLFANYCILKGNGPRVFSCY